MKLFIFTITLLFMLPSSAAGLNGFLNDLVKKPPTTQPKPVPPTTQPKPNTPPPPVKK